MTKDDKTEVRQMLEDILKSHANETNGRLNVIHAQLVHIKEDVAHVTTEVTGVKDQVTTANGRTRKLEISVNDLYKENELHKANCPLAVRVTALETKEFNRAAIIKFVTIVAAFMSGLVGIIVSLINLKIK